MKRMERQPTKGKFDVAHIVSGSQLDFELTWLGNGRDDEEIMTVERMLGAVNSGEIRLGAQKSNGFGRLTLCVRKRSYDLMNKADRAAWIEDRDDGDEIKLPGECNGPTGSPLCWKGLRTLFLIRASAPVYEGDQSYTVNIEAEWSPYFARFLYKRCASRPVYAYRSERRRAGIVGK